MTDAEYNALYGSNDDPVSEMERITNALTPYTGAQLARMDDDAARENSYDCLLVEQTCPKCGRVQTVSPSNADYIARYGCYQCRETPKD